MIWIVRLLATPIVLASATVLLLTGVVIGLIGVAGRLAVGPNHWVTAGADLIRTIEDLPVWPRTSELTWVYFIQDQAGATKIGFSADPSFRRATLQTGHPEHLMLIRAIGHRSEGSARRAERELHERFEHRRLEGEWFDLSDRDLRQALRHARRVRQ